MGIFRRSPSPAVPAGQQHHSSKVHDDTSSKSSTSNDTLDPSRYAASPLQQHRPYHSNPSSTSPSPNLSVDYARSRSPLPSSGSTTTSERYHSDYLSPMRMARDGFIPASSSSASSSPQPGTNSSNASPWAGYLPPEQVTSADKAGSKGRARSKKDKKALQQEYYSSPVPASHGPPASNNTTTLSTPSHPRLAPTSTPTSTQPVEVRKLELSNKEKQRQSELNLARFSINGMLNLVEQRLAQEEKGQPANAGRAHGLGLNVSYGISRGGVQVSIFIWPLVVLSERKVCSSIHANVHSLLPTHAIHTGYTIFITTHNAYIG